MNAIVNRKRIPLLISLKQKKNKETVSGDKHTLITGDQKF
jgi:hypothetical protein